MKEDYTHITMILDRSGSMQSIREDVIGGFNTFIGEQKGQPGLATLSLVQFDTQNPYEVLHNFMHIAAVPELTSDVYVPRASTPLLDAMGRGINELERSLHTMTAEARPSQVIMVIITDGQENSSREFNRAQIAKMISEKQEKDKWQFVYMSADLNAVDDAISYGVHSRSVMAFDKTGQGYANAMDSLSRKTRDVRQKVSANLAFDADDRGKQNAEKRRKS